ncbi:splicing factor, CC1-like family [Piscirickettsia salmonis]|uniref:RNA recognition motif domain-containing protein n=1 Tax=Piscirickettsia salmonis TaxID=1238 RepID=UPI0012B89A07|nr:RNA-binding protein [Piscirickettsia salmonis]QGP49361.1 splicing factor, CC1-like family [Piscirickettsia salmonis]
MKKLYVGNLPYSADEASLEGLFSPYGAVTSVKVIQDRDTGRSKGFAFVEFDEKEAAEAALELDGKDNGGRPMKVSMAKPQEKRQPRNHY